MRNHERGNTNMLDSDDRPNTDLIEYDREELRAELECAAAEIDAEIKSLENHRLLRGEFWNCCSRSSRGPAPSVVREDYLFRLSRKGRLLVVLLLRRRPRQVRPSALFHRLVLAAAWARCRSPGNFVLRLDDVRRDERLPTTCKKGRNGYIINSSIGCFSDLTMTRTMVRLCRSSYVSL